MRTGLIAAALAYYHCWPSNNVQGASRATLIFR